MTHLTPFGEAKLTEEYNKLHNKGKQSDVFFLQTEEARQTSQLLDIKHGVNSLVDKCYTQSKEAGWWNNNDNEIRRLLSKVDSINPDDIYDLQLKIEGLLVEVEAARTSQKIALMHSELSEALEADRKGLMDDKLPQYKGIVVEFADAIIRICDLVGRLNEKATPEEQAQLNLANAIMEKLEFNKSRADHKPENRAKEGGKKY